MVENVPSKVKGITIVLYLFNSEGRLNAVRIHVVETFIILHKVELLGAG